MLTEEELAQINLLIKREGYLNFIKNIHDFLTQQRDFYTNCCNSFKSNNEQSQENIQRKTYVIRKAVTNKNIEESCNNEREDTIENNTKILDVPEINNKSSGNIINIIKREFSENIKNTDTNVQTKKYSEEEIKKIRKGRAIQKFYKNK